MDILKKIFKKFNKSEPPLSQEQQKNEPSDLNVHLEQANIDNVNLPEPPITESEENKMKWLDENESPFGIRVFDCRPFAQNTVTSSQDIQTANDFSQLRKSNGREYIGQLPQNGIKAKVDFSFNTMGRQFPDGAIFKAETMEEKWDIYKYAGYLFFTRSWTGELVYMCNYLETEQGFDVDMVVFNENKYNEDDPYFQFKVVEFLIYSHILNTQAPHPIPLNLADTPETISSYSFSLYGNRGYFASYE